MRLFVQDGLSWEKAASAELEEDATQWPRQVLTELFRVLPEISEYTPDVKFIKTNEEQGYALGVVVVTNATNSALQTKSTGGKPSPKALVPIIVKSGRLSPLDTLMSSKGKMFPLTAERLREVLYRPEGFELLSDDWNDSSLWQLFSPPGRADFGSGATGAGGVQYLMGPGMKQASLLESLDGTLLEPDVRALITRFEGDMELAKAAALNADMSDALHKLSAMETVSGVTADTYERVLQEMYPVDVAHMAFNEATGRYAIKTANRENGVLNTFELERGAFLKWAGAKTADRVDIDGSAVASAESNRAIIIRGPNGEQPRVIENSGFYVCYDAQTGKQRCGWVLTGLVDGQGNRLPITLYADSEGARTQDQIAGSYSGGSGREELPNDPPKGKGCFVSGNGDSMTATVPLMVKGSTSDGTATRYRCVDVTGEKVTVVLQRGMKAVACFPARKEITLPFNAIFVSTEREIPELVSKGADIEKVASALLAGRLTLTAAPGYDAYEVRYRQLPKLAAALPGNDLSYDDALYALCVAGLDSAGAYEAMTKAANEGRCEVLAQDIGAPAKIDQVKVATHTASVRDLRADFVKEATALPDAMTVDAVLSLGFINSENVRTFISQIPYLEKALNRICELVFASRLGANEIPEAAAARAARGLNDVIRGLKALALRQIDELP